MCCSQKGVPWAGNCKMGHVRSKTWPYCCHVTSPNKDKQGHDPQLRIPFHQIFLGEVLKRALLPGHQLQQHDFLNSSVTRALRSFVIPAKSTWKKLLGIKHVIKCHWGFRMLLSYVFNKETLLLPCLQGARYSNPYRGYEFCGKQNWNWD